MGIYIKDYSIPKSGECEHLILDFERKNAIAVLGNRKIYEIEEINGDFIDKEKALVLMAIAMNDNATNEELYSIIESL